MKFSPYALFFEPTDVDPKFPCGICSNNVNNEHKAVQCDFCNYWNHIECEEISDESYQNLSEVNNLDIHCCKICNEEIYNCPQNFDEETAMIENLNLDILTTPNLSPDPIIIYNCGSCLKKVGQRHKAVLCDLCEKWNHIKCDGIDNRTYEKLKKSNDSEKYFCKQCKETCFPFQKLSDDEFLTSVIKNIDIKEDLNLSLTPRATLKTLFNDFSSHNRDEPTSMNCDYYDLTSQLPLSRKL